MLVIATRTSASPLPWSAPPRALGTVVALAAIGAGSLVVLRVLPRANDFDRSGPDSVLDARVAA